jgi:short-subunit dehydrogenase
VVVFSVHDTTYGFWVTDKNPPPVNTAALSAELSRFTSVIVTGGSSGIGKSFIGLMGKLNTPLRFCNLSRTEPDIKSLQLNLRHIGCDLAKATDIAAAAEAVTAWVNADPAGGAVLLINNSGFGAYGRFPEPDLSHQLELVDVNVRAVLDLTGRLLPLLKTRGGAVVTVASTAAFQPTAYLAAYGASKSFVQHWSLALNEELRGTGVRTLVVCPGPTSTQFFRRAGLQQGSVPDAFGMTADEVVLLALRALAKGRAQVVTGWKNRFSTALVSKLPKPFAAWLAAKVLARFRLKQLRR